MPYLYERAQFLYWRHRCLTYTVPPGTIAYSNDPADRLRLLRLENYVDGGDMVFITYPSPSMKMGWGMGDRFLHGCATRSGTEWLVSVSRLDCESRPVSRWGDEYLRSLPTSARRGRGLSFHVAPRDWVTTFVAQLDPDRPWHFTMTVVVNGRRNIVDGWLDDHGTVALDSRDGIRVDSAAGDRDWWPLGSTDSSAPRGELAPLTFQ